MKQKIDYKKWCFVFSVSVVLFILLLGGMNIVVDPFFHYHKPILGLACHLEYERYQNTGILRHFDYDSVIVGTSMAENFKPSEWDEMFDANTVKVPAFGATYKEMNGYMDIAFQSQNDIKNVVWGLDYCAFNQDSEYIYYDLIPTYLYDDNPFNDVHYVLNKSIFIIETIRGVLIPTLQGSKAMLNFDYYANWTDNPQYGKAAVLAKEGERLPQSEKKIHIDFNPDNIRKNILSVVEKHPDTDFYIFFTPYSIVYFDRLQRQGLLENQLEWERLVIEELLRYDNIHLYSFFDDADLITNLDNYKDSGHYGPNVNSYILRCMEENKHEIDLDNYEDYLDREYKFLTTYDYDTIYE